MECLTLRLGSGHLYVPIQNITSNIVYWHHNITTDSAPDVMWSCARATRFSLGSFCKHVYACSTGACSTVQFLYPLSHAVTTTRLRVPPEGSVRGFRQRVPPEGSARGFRQRVPRRVSSESLSFLTSFDLTTTRLCVKKMC